MLYLANEPEDDIKVDRIEHFDIKGNNHAKIPVSGYLFWDLCDSISTKNTLPNHFDNHRDMTGNFNVSVYISANTSDNQAQAFQNLGS